MKNLRVGSLAAIAVMALLLAGVQAKAQEAVSEQGDGSVAVSVEGEQFVVSASIAAAVAAAVGEHSDDPEALKEAIRAIIAKNAAGSDDTGLATAIAALAIYHARTGSASIAAIVQGATVANPDVRAGAILAVMPTLRAEVNAQEAVWRQLAQLRATVENPSQMSPVQ